MDTMQAVLSRHSVRTYTSKQMSDEMLHQILAAGCAAPVGMGMYDHMHLTVVQDEEILRRISTMVQMIMKSEADPLYGAKTMVIVSAKGMPAPGLDYTNAGCIAQNMMLSATDLGLGSVIVWGTSYAVLADAELRKALDIPAQYNPLLSVVFGHTQEVPVCKDAAMRIGINQV